MLESFNKGICNDLVPSLLLPVVGVILVFFLIDFLLSPITTFEAVSSIAESTGSGSGNGGGFGLLKHIINYIVDFFAFLAAAIF